MKNLKLNTWDGRIWYPTFYDLDTVLGIDNSGYLTIPPNVEIEAGSYNTSNSNLWTKVWNYFNAELKEEWAKMRQDRFTLDNLMKYIYGEQISKIPTKLYNDDAQVKYLEFGSLYTYCCHGSKEHQIRRWLRERIAYVDSMMGYFTSQDDQVTIRMNKTGYVEFQITPYIPLYLSVKWSNASNGTQTFKVGRGETKTFYYNSTTATDQEIIIPYASQIKRLDNLSNLNPSSCILSNATKLTNVEIHSSELYNINVTNNKYLRRVDLENCVALGTVTATGSSLNLSNCKYLRYCNVYNTALTEVQLNTSGGSLIEIYYPKTIQNVQLIKQRLLEVVGLPYGKPNMLKNCEILEGIRYTWGLYDGDYYDEPKITENSSHLTFKGKIFVEYGINYIFKLPGNGAEFRINEFDKDNKYIKSVDVSMLSAGVKEGTYTPSAENVSFICIVGSKNISVAKQLRVLREGQDDIDETPTSLYNIDIEECPSIKKLNTSSDPNIYNTFASMVYCNNLTLRNALDLQTLNFDGFHRLTKVIIENMYNLETVGFNNLLPKGETSTIKYIGLSNCPLLEAIEMNCTSNDYEITFSDGAILNFGGLLALKTITSNCVLKGIKTIVLPLGLESMFFTNEYGSGYSTIQNLWSSAVCSVNTDGATPKATHVDSTYIGIDFANMNLKNIDLGALVNIPKAINFKLSPTTVNPHFNLNRDGETYPYLKPIGTLDLSNYTESLARFFDGVDLDKLQIVCNNNLPQTDLSYCFYNSSFSSLSAIENLLTRVSNITNLDYCFYRTTIDSLNVLNGINMGANSSMNYTFAECPNIRTLSNITISRNVTSVEGMFKGCPLTSISNITVNVSGSIKGLFMGCGQLTTINTFRIPNVTDLSNVFSGCGNLTTLIGFELPSSVTNISNLFNGCYALTTIENFTFSNNITEANTWYPPYLETLQNITINSSAVKLTNCTTLTTIRDFTLGTTDCSSMFEGCTSLTSDIVLPSTIVNCSNMFKNCTAITHIHSNWNNDYVNKEMIPTDCYVGCTAITHIDNKNVIAYESDFGLDYVPFEWGGGGFAPWNTAIIKIDTTGYANVELDLFKNDNAVYVNWGDGNISKSADGVTGVGTTHTYISEGEFIIKARNPKASADEYNEKSIFDCHAGHSPKDGLKNTLIEVIKVENSNSRYKYGNFSYCKKLKKARIDYSYHNGDSVMMTNYFRGSTLLEEVTLSNFPPMWSNGGFSYFFEGCSSLRTVNTDNILARTTENITMESMFKNCTSLSTLNLSRWDVSKVSSMNSMFYGCRSLTEDIIIPTTVTDCSNMFGDCTSMTHIHSNWNNNYVNEITATGCYSGCTAITHIDNVNVISYGGDLGLDYVPEVWGGGGFDAETTSTFEVVIPSDGYNVVICADSNNGATTNWGDSVLDSSASHIYSKSGTYIIKTKNEHINTSATIVNFRDVLTKILKLRKYIGRDFVFRQCTKLTSINLDNCEMSNGNLFYRTLSTNVTELSMVNTKLPSDTSEWNYMTDSPPNITEIRGIEDLDVSHVVSFKNLFQGFANLTSLDLSRWDTSNATSMENMFWKCKSLTEPPIKNIPNSVKNTVYMYWGCTALTEDVMIPSSVTDCHEMFKGCTSMTHIHSNWNNSYTNGITSTDCYSGCTAITHIDNENVIKSEYSQGLDQIPISWGGYEFYNGSTTIIEVEIPNDNYSLQLVKYAICVTKKEGARVAWGDGTSTSITIENGVSNTDITHVYEKSGTYIIKGHFTFGNGYPNLAASVLKRVFQVCGSRDCVYLFSNCKKLTYVNLSTLTKTEKGKFDAAFKNCTALETIDGLEYIHPKSANEMFSGCTSLTTLNGIQNLDMSEVTKATSMFNNCTSLQSLDLSNWIISENFIAEGLFADCTSLTTIIGMENWNINNFIDIKHMFRKCTSLTSITMPNFNPINKCDVDELFYGCNSLTNDKFNITGWHMSSKISGWWSRLFQDCRSLTELDLSSWVFDEQVTIGGFTSTFRGLTNCQTINLSSWNLVDNNTSASFGFADCPNLVNLNLGNNITLKSVHLGAFGGDIALSSESAVSIFNALADLSGTNSQTLHLPSQVIARLTSSQISIATNKNWNVTTT